MQRLQMSNIITTGEKIGIPYITEFPTTIIHDVNNSLVDDGVESWQAFTLNFYPEDKWQNNLSSKNLNSTGFSLFCDMDFRLIYEDDKRSNTYKVYHLILGSIDKYNSIEKDELRKLFDEDVKLINNFKFENQLIHPDIKRVLLE